MSSQYSPSCLAAWVNSTKSTVLRHDHLVRDVVALERAQRQGHVVGVVFHQQDLYRVHQSLPGPWSGPSQREIERRSLIDGALRPNPAAVPVDDASHRREADAGTLEFGRGV